MAAKCTPGSIICRNKPYKNVSQRTWKRMESQIVTKVATNCQNETRNGWDENLRTVRDEMWRSGWV